MADTPEIVTSPPIHDPETGIAMAGKDAAYPLNHRLRAEALVADGKDADPDGMISADLIADTKERLEAEAKAADEAAKAKEDAAAAAARELHAMNKDDLIATAQAEGVEHDPAARKAEILDAIETTRAANADATNEG